MPLPLTEQLKLLHEHMEKPHKSVDECMRIGATIAADSRIEKSVAIAWMDGMEFAGKRIAAVMGLAKKDS